MTEINLVPIIPKKFLALDLKKVVENQLEQTAKAIKVDFEVTTRTWDERPIFKIDKITNGRRIYTNDEIYNYVSGGTKPHIIRAKKTTQVLIGPGIVGNVNRLAFFANGFQPKTRVGWIGSNKGRKANSKFTMPEEVHHPGTKARGFDKAIKEKWDNEAPRQFLRALRNELAHRG